MFYVFQTAAEEATENTECTCKHTHNQVRDKQSQANCRQTQQSDKSAKLSVVCRTICMFSVCVYVPFTAQTTTSIFFSFMFICSPFSLCFYCRIPVEHIAYVAVVDVLFLPPTRCSPLCVCVCPIEVANWTHTPNHTENRLAHPFLFLGASPKVTSTHTANLMYVLFCTLVPKTYGSTAQTVQHFLFCSVLPIRKQVNVRTFAFTGF